MQTLVGSGSFHGLRCSHCDVTMMDVAGQRSHFHSDWHRYNLQRKVAGLPGVCEAEFEQRRLAAAVAVQTNTSSGGSSKGFAGQRRDEVMSLDGPSRTAQSKKKTARRALPERTEKAGFPCSHCEKSFPSERALDNHQRMLGLTTATQADEMADPEAWLAAQLALLSADECIFCGSLSEHVEANVAHMRSAHSFFVPDQEWVSDLAGLVKYLLGKVKLLRKCVTCGTEEGHSFRSAEATRKHMVDKGHVAMTFGAGDEAEIAQFYDFGDEDDEESEEAWEDVARTESRGVIAMDQDEDHELAEEDDGTQELILPNGVRLGHRMHRRYYKQYLRTRPEENQDEQGGSETEHMAVDGSSTDAASSEPRRGRSRPEGSSAVTRVDAPAVHGVLTHAQYATSAVVSKEDVKAQRRWLRTQAKQANKITGIANNQEHYRYQLL